MSGLSTVYRSSSPAADSSDRVGSLSPPSIDPKTYAVLCVVEGDSQGALFPLHGTSAWLGRKRDAPIHLTDDAVSLHHAAISRRGDGRHYLEDTGSLNGTFVNGARIDHPVALQDGDRVRLGDTVLRFSMLSAAQQQGLLQLLELDDGEALTLAYQRRHITALLRKELAAAARDKTELAVLLVNLDQLRRINETYHHSVGDEVVKLVARSIHRLIRPGDRLYRYDGGEFLVVTRGLSLRNAEILAKRMTRHVHELSLPVEHELVPITVTIGVTVWDGTATPPDGGALLECAEAALLEAKAAGPSTMRRRDTLPPGELHGTRLAHTLPPRRD